MADYADTPFPNPHEHLSRDVIALLRECDGTLKRSREAIAVSVRWRDELSIAGTKSLSSISWLIPPFSAN